MKNLFIVHPLEVKKVRRAYANVSEHNRPLVWSGQEWDYVCGSQIKNVYVFYKPEYYEEFINQIVRPCMMGGDGKIIIVDRDELSVEDMLSGVSSTKRGSNADYCPMCDSFECNCNGC